MQQTGRKAMVADYSQPGVSRQRGVSYLKVYVRLRPSEQERGAGGAGGGPPGELPYTIENGNKITLLGLEAGEGEEGRAAAAETDVMSDIPGAGRQRSRDHVFQFHRIFDVDTEQDAVYREVASHMVQHGFRGYNACCFAYGQTGSGKTFTMYGPDGGNSVQCPPHLQGIIPRIASALFLEASARSPFADTHITASLCEIYCDKIRDLGKAYHEGYDGGGGGSGGHNGGGGGGGGEGATTSSAANKTSELHARAEAERHGVIAAGDHKGLPARYLSENLELHEDAKGQVYVKGLVKMPMGTPGEVLRLVETGFRLRATHETRMNATSSRSHTVFTLHVTQHDRGTGQTTQSHLHFIDLAGSERLARSESTGQRMVEAQAINLSLTSLGKVVSSLGDGGAGGGSSPTHHIPFRDSKLTRLLQNSLGGSSYTTLVATVHPRGVDAGETLSTLAFAARCQSVVNRPRLNFVSPGSEDVAVRIRQLEAECAVLRHRVVGERLTGSLRMMKLCADAGLGGALGADGRFTTHPHGHVIGMTMEEAAGHPYVRRALTLLVQEPSEEDEEVYGGLQEVRAKILAAIAAHNAETGGGGGGGGGSVGPSRPTSAGSIRPSTSAGGGGGGGSRPGSARSTSGGGGGGGPPPPVPPSLAYAGAPLTDATLAAALASAISAMSTVPGGALHPTVAGVGGGGGFIPSHAIHHHHHHTSSNSNNNNNNTTSSSSSSSSSSRPGSASASASTFSAAVSPRQSLGVTIGGGGGDTSLSSSYSAMGSLPPPSPRRTNLLSPANRALAAGGGGAPTFTTAYTAGGSAIRVSATPIPPSLPLFGAGLGVEGGGGGGGMGAAGLRVAMTNISAFGGKGSSPTSGAGGGGGGGGGVNNMSTSSNLTLPSLFPLSPGEGVRGGATPLTLQPPTQTTATWAAMAFNPPPPTQPSPHFLNTAGDNEDHVRQILHFKQRIEELRVELATMRDERDAAIAHCAQSTRTSRHLTQAHVDFAVESARAAKARVEDTWGAQTAQLLQVVKDSTAIMGEQVRVAAATPRPLARVLLAEAAASGLLEGMYNSGNAPSSSPKDFGRPSSRGHTSGSSRQQQHSPSSRGGGGGGEGALLQDLPVSQALGDTLRQTGGWIERGVGVSSSRGSTPSITTAPAAPAAASPASASAVGFSLKRPDPTALHSTLPLGGDTAAMYKSYSAALRRAESAGASEIERVAAEGERLLTTHDAAAGAALREAGRVNALAGAEIADLRTTVASLTSRLQDSQRGEKLAVAAALAAPLGVVLGATTPILLAQQQLQLQAASNAPSPLTHRRAGTSPKRPPSSPSYPPHNGGNGGNSSISSSSSSSARVGGGALGMNSQHDPIAGAPSPWPAAHNAAALLASPVRWRPSKVGAFPPNPHSSASASSPLGKASPGRGGGAGAGGESSRASAFLAPGKGGAGGALPHPTLTDMLANVNSGRTESLGLPVAVAVARQQRQQVAAEASAASAAAASAAVASAPPPALPPITGGGVSGAGSLEGGSLAELDL